MTTKKIWPILKRLFLVISFLCPSSMKGGNPGNSIINVSILYSVLSPLHTRMKVTFIGIEESVVRTTTPRIVKVVQMKATSSAMNLTSFLPSPLVIAMIVSAFLTIIDLDAVCRKFILQGPYLRKAVHIHSWLIFVM